MSRIPTTPQRSYIMSRIRAKNTKPELLLRKALWAQGIRYRLYCRGLPGKPDIVIKKSRLAIFVDGEFWHGFQWHKTRASLQNNRDYWIPKIERNMVRDRRINEELITKGYTVFRFWSEDIRKNLKACVNQIQLYIETANETSIPYSTNY